MWIKIKENWAKYLAVTIAAIYILIGLYAVLKPGWKEYKGEEFSIKYPASWAIIRGPEKDFENSDKFDIKELLVATNSDSLFNIERKSRHDTFSIYLVPKENLEISENELFEALLQDEKCCFTKPAKTQRIGTNKVSFTTSNFVGKEARTSDSFYLLNSPSSFYLIETTTWSRNVLIQVHSLVVQKIIIQSFQLK